MILKARKDFMVFEQYDLLWSDLRNERSYGQAGYFTYLNWTESVHRTLRFLFFFFFSPTVWNMCENLHYESVLISKSYSTTKNTVDRQYTERGQL